MSSEKSVHRKRNRRIHAQTHALCMYTHTQTFTLYGRHKTVPQHAYKAHHDFTKKRLASRSVGNTLINVHMQGETPLIVACAQGDYFDMKMLVAAGCQVNERSNIDDPSKLNDPQNNSCDRSTPLLVAAAGGFLDCVKYLIEEKKADTSAEDKVGF